MKNIRRIPVPGRVELLPAREGAGVVHRQGIAALAGTLALDVVELLDLERFDIVVRR